MIQEHEEQKIRSATAARKDQSSRKENDVDKEPDIKNQGVSAKELRAESAKKSSEEHDPHWQQRSRMKDTVSTDAQRGAKIPKENIPLQEQWEKIRTKGKSKANWLEKSVSNIGTNS